MILKSNKRYLLDRKVVRLRNLYNVILSIQVH
jgi:hypothetical protein